MRKFMLSAAVLIGLLAIPASASALKFTSAPGTPLTPAAAPTMDETVMPPGYSPLDITGADFNGDGYDDVAISSESSMSIYIYLGSASGALTPSASNPVGVNAVGPGHSQIQALDVDKDGDADLVAVSMMFPTVIEVYPNGRIDGSTTNAHESFGSFPPQTLSLSNEQSAADFNSASFGDKDGDGDGDMVIGTYDNSYFYVKNDLGFLNVPGDFTEVPRENPQGGDGVYFTAMGDYDGDGKGDLAMITQPQYDPENSSQLLFAKSSSANNYSFDNPPAKVLETEPGGYLSNVQTVDLNGDQYDDLTFEQQDAETGEDLTKTALGSPTGPVVQTTSGTSVDVYGASEPAVADYNGDGKQDTAIPQFVDEGFQVAIGDGNGGISLDQAGPFPLPKINGLSFYPQRTVALDVNNDGRTDFVTASGRSGDDDQALRTARGVAVMLGQPAPGISVAPESIDFGDVRTNAELIAPAVVKVTSSGDGALALQEATITGSGEDHFFVSGGECQHAALPSGDSCEIKVSVNQNSAEGLATADLEIYSDATGEPVRVPISVNMIGPDGGTLGKPKFSLKLKTGKKVKPGKKLVVTAIVKNTGTAASSQGFTLKAKGPKGKVRSVKSIRVKSLGRGKKVTRKFRIPVKRKAKGKFRVKVSLVAEGRTVKRQTGKVSVAKKKAKKKRRK